MCRSVWTRQTPHIFLLLPPPSRDNDDVQTSLLHLSTLLFRLLLFPLPFFHLSLVCLFSSLVRIFLYDDNQAKETDESKAPPPPHHSSSSFHLHSINLFFLSIILFIFIFIFVYLSYDIHQSHIHSNVDPHSNNNNNNIDMMRRRRRTRIRAIVGDISHSYASHISSSSWR